MPIHLPALSRRHFLAGTLAAGLLPHRLDAADAADPHAVALLADTHIAADRSAVTRGVNMTDYLMAVGKEVAGLPRRPAAAVVNGDLALKNGQAGDYAAFADLLQPVRAAGLPLHLTLGNHDQRDRFLNVVAPQGDPPVVHRHVGVVRLPRANLFLLDTLDMTDGVPGQLGAEQLAWLGRALDAAADKPAIVIGHHHPEAEVPAGHKPAGLIDTVALFKLLEP